MKDSGSQSAPKNVSIPPLYELSDTGPDGQWHLWRLLGGVANVVTNIVHKGPPSSRQLSVQVAEALSAIAAVLARGDSEALGELRRWTRRQAAKPAPTPLNFDCDAWNEWISAAPESIRIAPEPQELARRMRDQLSAGRRFIKQQQVEFVEPAPPKDAVFELTFRATSHESFAVSCELASRLSVARRLARSLWDLALPRDFADENELAEAICSSMPMSENQRTADPNLLHKDDPFNANHGTTIRAAFRAAGYPHETTKNFSDPRTEEK